MSQCYTYKGFHIPGCMGCAVAGHDQCTCPSPGEKRYKEDVEQRVAEMEERLRELEDREKVHLRKPR